MTKTGTIKKAKKMAKGEVLYVDLGEGSGCTMCWKRYCTCVKRRDGTIENELPVIKGIPPDEVHKWRQKVYCRGCRWCGGRLFLQPERCLKSRKEKVKEQHGYYDWWYKPLTYRVSRKGCLEVNFKNDCKHYAKKPWWMVWRG